MPNFLYLLVRTDMASQGRGKGMAQASHAANAFTFDTIIRPALDKGTANQEALAWCYEADGFGTAIVLECSMAQLEAKITFAQALGFASRLVVDPEYHLQDGDTHHIIPNIPTSGYIFGDKDRLRMILSDLFLMPNDPLVSV